MTEQEIVEELIYRSYRNNRLQFPKIEWFRWKDCGAKWKKWKSVLGWKLMAQKHLRDNFPQTTSIRIPEGLKEKMKVLLDALNERAGVHITRSEFMVMATKYYLKYLFNSKDEAELQSKLTEFVDNPPE